MVDAVGIAAIGPILLQRIRIAQIHPLIVHVVHHEVHAGEVVRGAVEFLSVEMHMLICWHSAAVCVLQLLTYRKQQRP